jgi:WD40 repeat protein
METIKGHSGEWTRKIISLDETHLAVGFVSEKGFTIGKTIRIVSPKSGGEFRKLKGHSADVYALVKLDENLMASGSRDTSIKIWQWTSGKLTDNLTSHRDSVTDLLAIKNFSQLVSCSQDMTIKVWTRSSGQVLKTLTGHFRLIKCIVLLKKNNDDHQQLASGSADGTIRIWNLTLATRMRTLTGHHSGSTVQCLVSLNNSQLIVSCATDWQIKLWSLDYGGQVRKTLRGHSNVVNTLVLLPNGHLASGSNDGTIRLWNLNDIDRPLVKTMFAHNMNSVFCLALLRDGNLASGSKHGTIKIWHFDSNSTNYTGE